MDTISNKKIRVCLKDIIKDIIKDILSLLTIFHSIDPYQGQLCYDQDYKNNIEIITNLRIRIPWLF